MPGNPHITDTTTRPAGSQLLAVYRDEGAAARATAELEDGGLRVNRAAEADVRDELRAEMKQESEGLSRMAMPAAPMHTEEMTRWALPTTVIATIVGAGLFALLSLVIDIPDVGDVQEVIWFAVIGAFAFATGAWFVGGLVGSRLSNHIPAAQRGVTLVVEDGSQATADLLTRHDPIRIDRRDPDGGTETIVTERDLHPEIQSRRAGRQWKGTDRADD